MTYVHHFNHHYATRHRDAALLRSTRSYPRSPHDDFGLALLSNPTLARPLLDVGFQAPSPSVSAPSSGPARRGLDLSKSGIKILVPRSPMNGPPNSETAPSEAGPSEAGPSEEAPTEEARGTDAEVSPEVAPEQSAGGGPVPRLRARMGIRSRSRDGPLPTPGAPRALNGRTGAAEEAGVTTSAAPGASTRRRPEERGAFDKRLRFSVRQTESAYRYRDILVKKQDGFTHIMLATKSSENNALNPEVMKEIQSAMATAASDDSKLVLLGAVGGVFCRGLDFVDFVKRLADDSKKESIKMAETIRTFVNTFIQFRKPLVAAVNGPALGLGAAILPLCDVVWANEKAWFQTPYAAYGQTPDACASFTFPRIMGAPSANELLLSGRKLTAQEACSKGLVSQVLWPATFMQEVMLRVKELVAVDSLVLRESKALMRNSSRSYLEQTNERECEALKRIWGSSQGTDAILRHLQSSSELY
ncbi:chromodomain Y-like protein isoform X2 [Stigmatopora nigra]